MDTYLQTPLQETFWMGFDTETTGVNTKEDRLVTASLITRRPGKEDEIQGWLANPGIEIPAVATAVHGITNEKVQSIGRPLAEVLDEVAAQIHQGWQLGGALVGFNLGFDLQILENNLLRCNLPTLRERNGGSFGALIDPLTLDRGLYRGNRKRKLIDLCKVYEVQVDSDFHDAEVDVLATLDLLAAMCRFNPDMAAAPLGELQDYQRRTHANWANGFNAWLESKGRVGNVCTAWPYDLDEA
ncbi:DNA polymerase III subunit epsilon [Actinomycetaceae bacterium TAE3-ERU4]|nr:DNA polymerase III subunit epsilon [Actinomycetaceae bacterium TAE3-ERU4]